MTRYQNPINTRRESRTLVGRMRGGKLNPVCMHVLRESESCMLAQDIVMELDPIAGQMRTAIKGEFISVFVPLPAIDDLALGGSQYAGNTELIRDKLVSGTPLYNMVAENEISKRCGIVPRSNGGIKQVNQIVHIAHNAAVNFLRQRKFIDTVKVLSNNLSVTPALISQTVLDRFNAVLDPDDRINGAVQLSIPDMVLPVQGFGIMSSGNNQTALSNQVVKEAGSTGTTTYPAAVNTANTTTTRMRVTGTGTDLRSDVTAILSGASAGAVSLTDFYNAELMDTLVRQMREMADANPEYGQEMIQRWAHGLSVDLGKTCMVIHESETMFSQSIVGATDSAGVAAETMRSDLTARLSFTVPVPKTELGGIIITFATVKPDETVDSQPHPFLSEPWVGQKYLADELSRDPVAVTMREIDATISAGQEGTIAFYTGLNELKRNYINYGFNRQIDLNTVANKTALWQIKIPLSVTPQSVLYPDNLDHYPFADQLAEVCTYTLSSTQIVATPMIFGPSPVETLAIINTGNLFDE